MRAIPQKVTAEEQITGLSCPDCMGVLGVRAEGHRGVLTFRCRTGHLYGSDGVIKGKERRLEEHLWASVTALEELATFLRELIARDQPKSTKSLDDRVARAIRDREVLLSVLAANQVTALEGDFTGDDDVGA